MPSRSVAVSDASSPDPRYRQQRGSRLDTIAKWGTEDVTGSYKGFLETSVKFHSATCMLNIRSVVQNLCTICVYATVTKGIRRHKESKFRIYWMLRGFAVTNFSFSQLSRYLQPSFSNNQVLTHQWSLDQLRMTALIHVYNTHHILRRNWRTWTGSWGRRLWGGFQECTATLQSCPPPGATFSSPANWTRGLVTEKKNYGILHTIHYSHSSGYF